MILCYYGYFNSGPLHTLQGVVFRWNRPHFGSRRHISQNRVDPNRNRTPCKIPYSAFHPHPYSTTRLDWGQLSLAIAKPHQVGPKNIPLGRVWWNKCGCTRVDLRLAHWQHVLPGKQPLHWRMSLLQ
jgi:hypothetical protein